MKITATKYAHALMDAIEHSQDQQGIAQNFIHLLAERKELKSLPKIMCAFEEVLAARRGVIKLRVEYPEKFKSSLAELEKSISAKLGKRLEVTAHASKSLIGGFRLIYNDTLVDGSVETQLKNLAQRIAS